MSEKVMIVERLERATGPDWKLNGEVKLAHAAFLIAEGKTAAEVKTACGGDLYDDPLPYTQSMDAAITLVPAACEWEIGSAHLADCYWASVIGVDAEYKGKGKTPAIALTLAAIKARQAIGG